MSKKQEKKTKMPERPKGKDDHTEEQYLEQRDFGGLPDRDLKKNLGCG